MTWGCWNVSAMLFMGPNGTLSSYVQSWYAFRYIGDIPTSPEPPDPVITLVLYQAIFHDLNQSFPILHPQRIGLESRIRR